jgi:hypothetical protein
VPACQLRSVSQTTSDLEDSAQSARDPYNHVATKYLLKVNIMMYRHLSEEIAKVAVVADLGDDAQGTSTSALPVEPGWM